MGEKSLKIHSRGPEMAVSSPLHIEKANRIDINITVAYLKGQKYIKKCIK